MSADLPPSSRARQWWDDMPRTQRVNRLLYGLALVSMLGLLVELGLGSPQTDSTLASGRAFDNNSNPSTTRPESPTSSVLTESPPSVPGGLSLADILSQITVPSIPEADAGATGTGTGGAAGGGGGDVAVPARATAPTAAPRSQPSGGGGGGGGGSPAAAAPAPAAPAPKPAPAPAPSNPPAPVPAPSDPPADLDPPASPIRPPSQPTQTTRIDIAPTMPPFPEIGIPTSPTSSDRAVPRRP